MIWRNKASLLVICLLMTSPFQMVIAQCQKSVVGMANMSEGDLVYVRQMAIRNALEQAVMQAGVSVELDQTLDMRQGLSQQQSRFRSNARVTSFQVISEELDDETGVLRVGLGVCVEALDVTDNGNQQKASCDLPIDMGYQNRVTILPPLVEFPEQTRDIANLVHGLQTDILRKLHLQGWQNVASYDVGQTRQPGLLITPNLSPEALLPIQEQTGAQFALFTVVRSMAAHNTDSRILNHIRRSYDFEVRPNHRFVELEWYLVELDQQQIRHQQRGGSQFAGSARVGRDKPVGTAAFLATPTGKALDQVVNELVDSVTDWLSCLPLDVPVLEVRGDDVVVYLHQQSGVRVGDQLAWYSIDGAPVRFQGQNLGFDAQPAGFVEVERLAGQFAVVRVVGEREGARIALGDRLRSW
ncbi:flagellar assembly protein T N-terminal domain-containing protein [Thiomicrospira sp. ALE5]|uniref:flagellar assembly protein T N-terminal domain-containing protein n=1 Tax=Thiomicrospira sp. ALE5 TaxID=748650 RepID=UPI0008E04531|nr:flagellar assembly protein T N-terminal domain-containing protein [Thiomicrospira sp. ALE5]SFR60127.1 Flagellar assembly protein T, N-terminal domain [Thiomicrospira sp. ALE5]